MPAKLRIRRASGFDAALLAELGERTFRDSFDSQNRPEDIDDYVAAHFGLAGIRSELLDPSALFLLAFKAERPVGYVKLAASPPPPCLPRPRALELVRIYVDRPGLGKGLGSALMQACLDHAGQHGYTTLWLGVWERNQRAIRFYERWGFRRMGSQPFVLGRQVQTDLVMARSVTLGLPGQASQP